ncbi:MAG: YihY/virulence factor BrkB family protein, partial [Hyphomicrobiales bacterium]
MEFNVTALGNLRDQINKLRPGKKRIPREQLVLGTLIGIGGLLGARDRRAPGPTTKAVSDDGRGRSADAPQQIPARGWKDIVWRVYANVQEDRVMLVAAGVTFYMLLAIFPATAALVTLYGLVADASVIANNLSLVSGFLPEGAVSVIGDEIRRIASHPNSTLGATLLFSLGAALWGANAGTKSIFDALNIIYKEREKRGFITLTAYSMLFTLGALALALLALASVVVVPVALNATGIGSDSATGLLTLLRWPLLLVMVLFALAALYRYGPSRTRPQWRWVSWGSGIAGTIWLGASLILSWYVSNFGNYNATYGSLGAVIGFMIWIWISTMIVLLGGEINAEMEHQTARDTT